MQNYVSAQNTEAELNKAIQKYEAQDYKGAEAILTPLINKKLADICLITIVQWSMMPWVTIKKRLLITKQSSLKTRQSHLFTTLWASITIV